MKNLEYHAFRKPKKLKNGKTVHRWYYYYIDAEGRQIQKSCGTKVRNHQAAEDFIRSLPPPPRTFHATQPSPSGDPHARPVRRAVNRDMLVRDIAQPMFIPGSEHLARRQQLKKSISPEVIKGSRVFINYIIEAWGDRMLRTLEMDEMMNYLFSVKRSGSWKNQYISVLNEVYQEGQFLGCKIYKPDFPRIGMDCKKADIFTDSELDRLFRPENFSPDLFFLFFLTTLSGGLRLGEIRGMRVRQIIFDLRAVIVDGYLKDNGIRTTYNKKGTPEHPKLRAIPYPSLVLRLLEDYIAKEGRLPEDFVFQYGGKPVSKSMAQGVFRRAMMNAGITYDKEALKEKGYWRQGHIQKKTRIIPDGRRLVPHSLRYTFVTKMRRGMAAEDVKKMTGHESTDMVDYYNRANLEMALASIPNADAASATLLPTSLIRLSGRADLNR